MPVNLVHEILDYEDVSCTACNVLLEPGTWVAVDHDNAQAWCDECEPAWEVEDAC
jgi:hypothetical protein